MSGLGQGSTFCGLGLSEVVRFFRVSGLGFTGQGVALQFERLFRIGFWVFGLGV